MKNSIRLLRCGRGNLFTTGQVAEICSVAPRTACKWFDQGKLKGFQIPGSNDRRIFKDSLLEFLREHKIPIPEGLGQQTLLVISSAPLLPNHFRAILTDWHVESVTDLFSAGLQVAKRTPAAILFDFHVGRADCLKAAQSLTEDGPKLYAFTGADESSRDEPTNLFHAMWTWPTDLAVVAQKIKTDCESKED